MARVKPHLRVTETYTEPNFLRLHTRATFDGECKVTIEHLCYEAPQQDSRGGWSCKSIVDGERMSKDDALVIARGYAEQMEVPVIYECHED